MIIQNPKMIKQKGNKRRMNEWKKKNWKQIETQIGRDCFFLFLCNWKWLVADGGGRDYDKGRRKYGKRM